ncbi:MAG: hypothetical protein V1833_04235 [Elusimicrobiota bacterium]
MNTQNYTQIVTDLQTLPVEKLIEAADFIRFLKTQIRHSGIPLSEARLTTKEASNL